MWHSYPIFQINTKYIRQYNLLCYCFILLSFSLPAQTKYYVDSTSATPGNGLSWASAFDSLQTALDLVNIGDTIWVAKGTYYPSKEYSSFGSRFRTFNIDKDIAIFGGFDGTETLLSQRDLINNPTILNGDLGVQGSLLDNAYHVLWLESLTNAAVIDGFTISWGSADGGTFPGGLTIGGGGIYTNAASPNIKNCIVIDNFGVFGGGIYNYNNSNPIFSDCSILQNVGDEDGGGMYNYDSHPLLINTEFESNLSFNGGAIVNNLANPTITDCTFENNVASGNGGAIYNINANPIFDTCLFSENQATAEGGGVFNTSTSNSTYLNCTFYQNFANNGGAFSNGVSSPIFENSYFSNNRCSNYGGAVINRSSPINYTNCTFYRNSGKDGGALNHINSNSILLNCSFKENGADMLGGGIFSLNSFDSLANCEFFENGGVEYGGALYNWSSDPTLTNCTFYHNQASEEGGAIANQLANPAIYNSIIWGNNVAGNTSSTSASIYNNGSLPIISYCDIANSGGSTAWQLAIGIDGTNNIDEDPLFVDASNGDLNLQTCSPAINAGLDNYNTTLTDLAGNPRKLQTIDMGVYENQNGIFTILYVDSTSMVNDPIGSNWSNAYNNLSDALAFAHSCENIVEIWVAKGTYFPSQTHGGATDRHQTFYINKDFQIYGGFDGTEMVRTQRNPSINPTILSGELGIINDDSDNSYHVLWIDQVTDAAILDGFSITNGNADGFGGFPSDRSGGLLNYYSNIAINNCIFYNNSGVLGGALVNDNSRSILSNCLFYDNLATKGAAAINFSQEPTFVNCDFNNNLASDGGAIYNSYSSPNITSCKFYDNQALFHGGAIRNEYYNAYLTNCLFYNNTAKYGGAISNNTTDLFLDHCTFYNNTANQTGGAVSNYNSPSVSLFNCILWGNRAAGITTSTSASIYNNISSANISYSLIANSGASGGSWQPAIGIDGGNNLDIDPVFSNVANEDFRLDPCSPAMEAGGTMVVHPVDLDGNPRPFSATTFVDMGAYEVQAERPKPIATCRDITIYLDADGEAIIDPTDINNGSSVVCGSLLLFIQTFRFDCSNIGTNTVKLYVVDLYSQKDSCEATVTVLDTVAPIAICQNLTVPLDPTGNANISADQIDNGSNDSCGIATIALDQTDFTCAHVGDNTVTLTVTDNNGNSSTCTATVTITKNNTELLVTGGNPAIGITNGDTTPDVTDGTDFGTTTTQSYTIDNSTNNSDLEIGSIVLSDNTNFNLTNVPSTILAGNSSTFDVNFTAMEGLFTTTVTITSSNCNYTVFIFTIQAGMEEPACPSSQDITGIIPSDTYEASGIISSDGTVADTSNVIFKAEEILLTIGFTVEQGGVFLAQVAPCIPSNLTEKEPNPANRELAKTIMESVEKILPENSIQAEQKQDQQTKKATLTIYPNPTNSQLNLLCDCEIVAYRIMDSSGKIVKEGRQSHTTIDQLENLSAGLYFLQVLSTEGSFSKQFVKQ